MPPKFLMIKIISLVFSAIFIGKYLLAIAEVEMPRRDKVSIPASIMSLAKASASSSMISDKVKRGHERLIKFLGEHKNLSISEQLNQVTLWSSELQIMISSLKVSGIESGEHQGPEPKILNRDQSRDSRELFNLELLDSSLQLLTGYKYLQRSDCALLRSKLIQNFEPLAGSAPQSEPLQLTWKILDQICQKDADQP